MKTIALVGAPGSGKTRLAQAIEDAVIKKEGCGECATPVSIVDSYADEVRERDVYEIGLKGDYMANTSIAVARYNRERWAFHEQQAKTIITCGTVIETSVYLSMNFEEMIQGAQTDDEKREVYARIEGTVKFLSVMYMDTFKYDKAFYLPPKQIPDNEDWLTFERNLQAGFNAFNAPVAPILVESWTDEEDYVRQQLEVVFS